jgi:Domain of unknown function (DUF1707)
MNESERVGNAERDAAVEALKVHQAAGRLDPTEYEDRSLRARQARTWAELDPLFTDLPSPGPRSPSTLSAEPPTARPIGMPAASALERSGGWVPEPYAYMVVAAAPILALILFFATDSWWWFLAIPLVGAIVYGPQGGPNGHGGHGGRGRNRRRDR